MPESIITIAPAVRRGSFVLLGIYGPSGAGKTHSAILVARGLVGPEGKVGLLDTETGRGRLHAGLAGGFDYAELTPPHTPERYAEAIDAFERYGTQALIVDSVSHEWEGIGGIAEAADALADKYRGAYGQWAKPKARHKRFMARLNAARMHMILCCRARQPVREEKGADGKTIVTLGDWHAIQEKNFIYDMTAHVLLRPDKTKSVTKCPDEILPAFGNDRDRITVDTGRLIAEWVGSGEAVDQRGDLLLKRARDKADEGMAALEAWWKALAHADQKRLKDELPNLKSKATFADEQRKAEEPSGVAFDNPFVKPTNPPAEPAIPDHQAAPEMEPMEIPIGADGMPDLSAYKDAIKATIEMAPSLHGLDTFMTVNDARIRGALAEDAASEILRLSMKLRGVLKDAATPTIISGG